MIFGVTFTAARELKLCTEEEFLFSPSIISSLSIFDSRLLTHPEMFAKQTRHYHA